MKTNEVLHEMPDVLQEMLSSSTEISTLWDSLTPLAQNEWICWMTIAKKEETREKRRQRFQEDLLAGKKRPCCWPGCPHRRESAKKWFK